MEKIKLSNDFAEKNLLPSIQYGFKYKDLTVEQIHRVVNTITQALENKELAPAIFLDVSSAFECGTGDLFTRCKSILLLVYVDSCFRRQAYLHRTSLSFTAH